ncbi:MAG TPA: hypothetical protein VK507_16325, partial [Iamia sp.]|nr:hypothetical protein [Iamia sp.]
AESVPVLAPFTGPVETLVRTGETATVSPRLTVDQKGVATLVGLTDGTCRLILALAEPIDGKLSETFDDWETGFIIQRVAETASRSMEARQSGAATFEILLGGPTLRTTDDVTLIVEADEIIVDDVPSSRPPTGHQPCPHGWWSDVVEAMGD